jgi:hypothetical protein
LVALGVDRRYPLEAVETHFCDDPRVRRTGLLAVLLVAVLAGAAPAAAKQSIAVSPNPVHFGETQVVAGKGWPVIEFCSRTVRLSLRSAQNAFRIGTVRVGERGRFHFDWIPRRAKVGAGLWLLVARMHCESGKDGSPVPVRASVPIRIRG